jgi:hypothetical protein
MFKVLLTLLLFMGQSHAVVANNIIGSWYSSLRTLNNGTETIEKENLTFHSNNTFMLVLLVSLKKDLSYVKDLRIEVAGNWEAKGNALIYTINSVNVPSAKDVYGISKQSLDNLAEKFKYKWVSDKIHIYKIISLEPKKLSVRSEKGRTTNYKRQY